MTRASHLIRRLTLSILMPLLLLVSQQGALLHELSHWHVATAGSVAAPGERTQAADSDADLCLTCLAYAQVGGLAKFELPIVPAIDSLSYHFAPQALRHVAAATPPVARNRGPPQTV